MTVGMARVHVSRQVSDQALRQKWKGHLVELGRWSLHDMRMLHNSCDFDRDSHLYDKDGRKVVEGGIYHLRENGVCLNDTWGPHK